MELYEKAVRQWQAWSITSIEGLELHLDSFRVLFAYHSGKIENEAVTYADTREIFENGRVCGYTGEARTIFEMQNQKLCYDYLKDKIVEKKPVTLELLLEVHRILTSGTYDERRYVTNGERPGEFKHHDYVTGIHEVGAYPDEVPQAVRELLEELKENGAKNPLLAAAYFHAALENIHPFADGNGRVGRTMMNYWLMINDYPPVVIHEENRCTYYNALQAYDENESLQPLMQLIQDETVQTWQRQMQILQQQRTAKNTLDLLCADAISSAEKLNDEKPTRAESAAPTLEQ